MRPSGWFELPGVQSGARTVEEQLRGLAPALDAARGKSVVDLGCAEGAISLEFLKADAASVQCYDNNGVFLKIAEREASMLAPELRVRIKFEWRELNNWFERADRRDVLLERYDVVLALAVLHKMHDPALCASVCADMTGELMVIRLPMDSEGKIEGKHTRRGCDLNKLLPTRGLALKRTQDGPRRELVQYWRRA